MTKVCVITNTIRRPVPLVQKSIESSLNQVFLDLAAEVVLVDQNPAPISLPAILESNPRFSHQHVVVPSVSAARNRARYSSDVNWLIFCDDDGYMGEGYLAEFQRVLAANPETDVFAGSIKRIDNQDFYSKRHALGGDMKWFHQSKLLMGSNFAIRRSTFESLGKFDERFGAGAPNGSSEETDLAWNAFFHHRAMKYVPELVVMHIPPFSADTKSEIQKAFRYGRGKSALIRKWLFRGKIWVLYEVAEMIVVPLIKIPLLLLRFRFNEIGIQLGALAGRLVGLFS